MRLHELLGRLRFSGALRGIVDLMALDCTLTRVEVSDGPMKRVGLGDAAGKLLREALVT